ncbi:uncharacterized protein VTP21DRAFT_10076 [Calcarisporiella thermophila]|uniref:uncharacterized protein n=1 Tax=Calcarisporiella thermophila TaxID=911321 RepID=UPI00374323A3
MSHAIVYGGAGALGQTIVSVFKKNGWLVSSIDLKPNQEANHNVLVDPKASLPAQGDTAASGIAKILNDQKVNAIVCVAGGFAMGNAQSNEFLESCDLMLKQSVHSSVIAASLAAKFLKEGGLLTLTGANGALNETPGILGYGMSKAAVHHLTRSLAAPGSGLPQGARVNAILPITLDTPMNRKFMPDADFSTWTPLDVLAEQIFNWASGKLVPQSGKLVQVVTKNSQTSFNEI